MNQIKLFIELTRLKKPIGFLLLFWPCAWGLTLAYDFSSDLNNYFYYLILFFLGSVLMRSAGCIVNDILDKEFDAKVFRTKNRPIASGKISTKLAIYYSLFLCFLALLVLINFNFFTIVLALGSILMRSAGCIVNDILDKEFDAKVFRTKDRPIASGKISIKIAITYSLILCFLALLVLLNFNLFTIILA